MRFKLCLILCLWGTICESHASMPQTLAEFEAMWAKKPSTNTNENSETALVPYRPLVFAQTNTRMDRWDVMKRIGEVTVTTVDTVVTYVYNSVQTVWNFVFQRVEVPNRRAH